jgi:hypothetical protein
MPMDDAELDRIGQSSEDSLSLWHNQSSLEALGAFRNDTASGEAEEAEKMTNMKARYVSREVLRSAREEKIPRADHRESPEHPRFGLRNRLVVFALGCLHGYSREPRERFGD